MTSLFFHTHSFYYWSMRFSTTTVHSEQGLPGRPESITPFARHQKIGINFEMAETGLFFILKGIYDHRTYAHQIEYILMRESLHSDVYSIFGADVTAPYIPRTAWATRSTIYRAKRPTGATHHFENNTNIISSYSRAVRSRFAARKTKGAWQQGTQLRLCFPPIPA